MFNFIRYCFLQLYGLYVFRKRVDVVGLFSVSNPHNIFVGERLCLNKNVYINARSNIFIGSNVILSYGVTILAASLDIEKYIVYSMSSYIPNATIHIGSNVWIGANSIVLAGSNIGDNVVVAAGSVVRGNLVSNSLYAGNPAVLKRTFLE